VSFFRLVEQKELYDDNKGVHFFFVFQRSKKIREREKQILLSMLGESASPLKVPSITVVCAS